MIEIALEALSLLSFSALPPPEVIALFDLREFHSVQELNPERNVLYRLFRPVNLQPKQLYPLIVWLHGYGEEEFNQIGVGQLHHTVFVLPSLEAAENSQFFLLAIQCPKDQRGFFRTAIGSPENGNFSPEPGEVVIELVEQLVSEEQIDRERMSLVGISGGATDAWEMAMRRPSYFAAMAPLGGGEVDLGRIKNVVDLPIWAFHSRIDTCTSVKHVRTAVSKLQNAGGKAYLTEVNGGADFGHDCQTKAFSEFPLKDWLLAQQRGVESPPPLEGEWGLRLKVTGEEIVALGIPYYLPLPLGVIACWFVVKRQFQHRLESTSAPNDSSP